MKWPVRAFTSQSWHGVGAVSWSALTLPSRPDTMPAVCWHAVATSMSYLHGSGSAAIVGPHPRRGPPIALPPPQVPGRAGTGGSGVPEPNRCRPRLTSLAGAGRLVPGAVLRLARQLDDRTLLDPLLLGGVVLPDLRALDVVGVGVAVHVVLDARQQRGVGELHGPAG